MSSSLLKKRNPSHKENLQRLSSSKLVNVYPPLSKLNCSELVQDKAGHQDKGTRKTARPKATSKHHLSVEYILRNKPK